MKLYQVVTVFCAFISCNYCLLLSDFYAYGNTSVVLLNERFEINRFDGFNKFDIPTHHIPFFGKDNNVLLQVFSNGLISFQDQQFGASFSNGLISFQDQQFRASISRRFPYSTVPVSLIAPLWSLPHGLFGAEIYLHVSANGPTFDAVAKDVRLRFDDKFNTQFLVLITWVNVNVGGGEMPSSFQLALASNENSTVAIFNYDVIDTFVFNGRSNISHGNMNTPVFFNHELVDNPEQLHLMTNVGQAGKYMYLLKGNSSSPRFPRVRTARLSMNSSNGEETRFICTIPTDEDAQSVYEISWLDDTPEVIKVEILTAGQSNMSVLNLADVPCYGVKIFCKVRSWYNNTSNITSPSVESSKYFVGIKVSPSSISAHENSAPITINLIATVPIRCTSNLTQNCSLKFRFKQTTMAFVFDRCNIEFYPDFLTQTVTATPQEDFTNDLPRRAVTNLNLDMNMGVKGWNCYRNTTTLNLELINAVTGECHSNGDPHFRTFDHVTYDMYEIGDFVLVQSPINSFAVHARTFNCHGRVTCNCGVAAQENDDIIIIDACMSTAPKFRFVSSKQLHSGTSLQKLTSKNFKIKFPSGAEVTVRLYNWGRGTIMNIKISVPALYFQQTVGLCGTFDRQRVNDMTSRQGVVYPITRLGNISFIRSWKLRNQTSLFFQTSGAKSCSKSPERDFCTCADSPTACTNVPHSTRPAFNSDFQSLVTAAFSKCDIRKRRDNTAAIIIPEEGDDKIYDYNPADQIFTPPTWPTPSGKTKEMVERFCIDALTNSTIGKACNSVLGNDLDLTDFQFQCVTDIQISDLTDYSQTAVAAMESVCTDLVLKGKTKYWVLNNNGILAPPLTIGNSICPNDCTGNGDCVNATCQCNTGFVAEDCSLVAGQAPTLTSTFKLCDIRKETCLLTGVDGNGFIESVALKCKVTGLVISGAPPYLRTVQVDSSAGQLLSFAEVLCTLPSSPVIIDGDPALTVGNPVGGFEIQISNDGAAYSDTTTTFIVFDSKCKQCNMNNGICTQKSNTCHINGFCFAAGELNPSSSSQHCDPLKSTTTFVSIDDPSVATPPPVECNNTLCDGKTNGNYEYNGNTHYFLQCSNGIASCQYCWPIILHFVERCNQCMYSLTDPCYTTKPWQTPITYACPEDECSKRGSTFSENIADPNEPRHFISCWNGQTVACMNCPANLHFKESIKACDYP